MRCYLPCGGYLCHVARVGAGAGRAWERVEGELAEEELAEAVIAVRVLSKQMFQKGGIGKFASIFFKSIFVLPKRNCAVKTSS